MAQHHRDKLAETAYVTRESQQSILREIIREYGHGERDTSAPRIERNTAELRLMIDEDYELARARAERENVTVTDVVRTEIERRWLLATAQPE